MAKTDRTSYYMDVEFDVHGEKIEESVRIPFPIFINGIRDIFDGNLVNLDGTDNAIWNTFVDLGCLDTISEMDSFIDYCKKEYMNSQYYEEDLEEIIDDYDFEHNIGKYKEEDN